MSITLLRFKFKMRPSLGIKIFDLKGLAWAYWKLAAAEDGKIVQWQNWGDFHKKKRMYWQSNPLISQNSCKIRQISPSMYTPLQI